MVSVTCYSTCVGYSEAVNNVHGDGRRFNTDGYTHPVLGYIFF